MSFIIASDIGGVIKNMTSDDLIYNSIESLKLLLSDSNNSIIFISKCKSSFQQKIIYWMQENIYNIIGKTNTFFCENYDEKYQLFIKMKANVMIDDKLQVFKSFPDDPKILKIWFTSDYQKINGAIKYQPEEVNKVIICNSWNDIVDKIIEFKKKL